MTHFSAEFGVLMIRNGFVFYLLYNTFYFFATEKKYSALQGNFASPGYPNNYPENALQNYHIKINQNGSIAIAFEVFDLESSSACIYDYVKIYNFIGSRQILAATYCGQGPRKFISSTNEVLVQFKSDGSVNGKGFFARYKFGSAGKVLFI